MKHFEAIFSIAKESLLGGLLSGVNPDNCAQLEQCYLHDFVRSVLPTSLKTTELASMDYEVNIYILYVWVLLFHFHDSIPGTLLLG